MSKETFDATRYNQSENKAFEEVLEASLSRRSILKGGLGISAMTAFGAFGLAGCNSINLNKPSAWHLLCNSPGNMLGEVAHSKEDKTWTTVFGPTMGRALLIDGLFILMLPRAQFSSAR